MQTVSRFAAPLLVLLPLQIGLAAQPAPPPAATSADERAEFQKAFQQAMAINSYDEMSRLVKKHQEQATFWVIETAEAIASQPNDTLFTRIAALKRAWKDAIRTDFVDHMEKYFSLLDGPQKRERFRLKTEYDKKRTLFDEVVASKDATRLGVLGNDFQSLADGFEQLGDYFHASQSWIFVGHCNSEENRGERADLKKKCMAYGNALETRDKIELKDKLYLEVKPNYESLVALGYGPKAPGEASAPAAAAAAGNSTAVAMSFEPWEDEKIERPTYYRDDLYPMWNFFQLREKGSSTAFPRLDPALSVLRVGSNDVQLDVDGDGAGDVEIPLTGNLETVECEIGSGETKRRWAFRAIIGLQKDVLQDIEVNLSPTDEYMSVYISAAGSVTGEIGGVPVRIIDDNLDGVYGSAPNKWLHMGLTEGMEQPELDSILVGDEKRARPWSEYQKIGEQWYKLEIANGGTTLKAAPVTLKTGTLKLDFGGVTPDYLIVQGANDYENSYFDLSSAKEVEVPVSRYTLAVGMVSKGKKRQLAKTLILPGKSTPKWTVMEGEEAEVALGKPFDIDFRASATPDSVIVDGKSVVVVGAAGERYERAFNAVLRPDASWRKAGTKRGSKPDKMSRVMTHQELADKGWEWAWFPEDVVLERKGKDEGGVEVQLVEKKHPIFGKLESSWRTAEG